MLKYINSIRVVRYENLHFLKTEYLLQVGGETSCKHGKIRRKPRWRPSIKILTVSIIREDYIVKKNTKSTTASIPSPELPPPHPPPATQAIVSLPPEPKGKRHTRLRAEGMGVSQFGRLEKRPSTLSTLSQAKELRARLDWNLKQQTTTFSLFKWPLHYSLLLNFWMIFA